MSRYVVALDEGSSSCRAAVVDADGRIVGERRRTVVPTFPQPRWTELDPVALYRAQLDCLHEVMADLALRTDDIAAIGITTHRETCLVWDRATSEPVHPAVMWMSKQTDAIVDRWREQGLDADVRASTGLFNDSFFSAPKVAWILENVPGVRARAERGELAFGTVDSWLLWNLTAGRSHLTDHSEASRTAMLSLETLDWDDKLLEAYGVPHELLPAALPSDAFFGEVRPSDVGLPGAAAIPVLSIMADQQSGMFGQACFEPGSTKNTFGTAGVLTGNAGHAPSIPDGLTGSVGWTVGGETAYEVEGVVFHSGQTMQWMRDKLGVLREGDDIQEIAGSVTDSGGVYVVPAFAGMCAPHWNREAHAGVVGLTLESTGAHVVRAGVEAMAYQLRDNVEALVASGTPVPQLKVDGGASRSDLLCQFTADILGVPVVRPTELERTALGVAQVAGVGVGMWTMSDVADQWVADRTFEPSLAESRRAELYDGWRSAVSAVLGRAG